MITGSSKIGSEPFTSGNCNFNGNGDRNGTSSWNSNCNSNGKGNGTVDELETRAPGH